MFDCKNLLHPFQNDPGTSQSQRIVDQLVSNAVKIDARSLADLLNFFSKLSAGINYYDRQLNIGTWQAFFAKSLPFRLASLSSYDDIDILEKYELYKTIFSENPSVQGLQLMLSFTLNHTFNKINSWYADVKGSGLPVENAIDELIRTRLAGHLKKFITLTNTSSKWFCVKKFDFTRFCDTADSDVWNLEIRHLYAVDNQLHQSTLDQCELLRTLYKEISDILPTLLEGLKQVAAPAGESLKESLVPQSKELQENHPPHLALVFAFISLFQKLQGELNKKTKQHLHYFYTEVLRIKPAQAIADKAHVIFEIQKLLKDQYEKYKVDTGTKLLAGRDEKNFDILFETEEEIIVNEAQVADLRTLFLNYKHIQGEDYLEGVYIAPNATKADGVEKDFKDGYPANWFTLGRDISKYTEPQRKSPKKHPQARLGFILASPVLYLTEGKRTITLTLDCNLNDSLCKELMDRCNTAGGTNCPDYSEFYSANSLYTTRVRNYLFKNAGSAGDVPLTYIIINEDLLDQALASGMNPDYVNEIRDFFLKFPETNECTGEQRYYEYRQVEYTKWVEFRDDKAHAEREAEIFRLPELFKAHYPLKVWLSGAEEWIEPEFRNLSLSALQNNGDFTMKMVLFLPADKPAVTFYNKEALKEDLGSTLPMLRVEIDDSLKVEFADNEEIVSECCLEKNSNEGSHYVSLYHFFRNVSVLKTSKIDVNVCGLKNLIVQNDESVQDINNPIFPFGTRPRVGASFYIGSKELFSKDWTEVYINAEWKDKPLDFGFHYRHYSYKNTTFEDGSKEIVNSSFLTTAYVLDKGLWKNDGKRRLFREKPGEQGRTKPLPAGFPSVPLTPEVPAAFCRDTPLPDNEDVYDYTRALFTGLLPYERRKDLNSPLLRYHVSSQYGFIRLELNGTSFQHDIYPFVLARHMMAYAGLLSLDIIQELEKRAGEAKKIIDAMNNIINVIGTKVGLIQTEVGTITTDMAALITELVLVNGHLATAVASLPGNIPQAVIELNNALARLVTINTLITNLGNTNANITGELGDIILELTKDAPGDFNPDIPANYGLIRFASEIKKIIDFFIDKLKVDPELKDGLPNEPYTPVIKTLSIDYAAVANIDDIDLIHLYPFAGTYKPEEISLAPSLFPTFCDEGTLFIGFSGLQPGSNLNILFQLAEATADSEAGKENVRWHVLDNNFWKDLRTGFEVLKDDTLDLTASGILKFALPENMSIRHTIMPKNIHWIKASLGKKSKSVSETLGIHTQAAAASFLMNENADTARLAVPLEPGSIEKLLVATPNIKGIAQPYESFGGRLNELESSYYVRVSERLRHKGRAIQKWDYERMVLEGFPVIYKVKCINHSFQTDATIYRNDIPYAPGYVILAVIPDLRRLKAGNSLEPKVPVSILNQIDTYLSKKISPFVRLKTSNPRYEKVHFCISVRFKPGVDESYYTMKLKSDIAEYLAPWAVGKYDKLTFGQCIYRSDIIRFIESTSYVDFIISLEMKHDDDPAPLSDVPRICPNSPRSILIAGNVDIITDPQKCDEWCQNKSSKIKCNQNLLVNDYCIPEAEPVDPETPHNPPIK